MYLNLWIPLKIQLHFRRQGIRGPNYHPIYGNTEEIKKHIAEARTKPMPFNHEIVQRVFPHFCMWSGIYGKIFIFWFGSNVRLNITEPKMIKELMLNHYKEVDKVPLNPPLTDLVGQGLPGIFGKKWALHRKITNQAFKMEKVKEWVPEIVMITMTTLKKWGEGRGDDEFEIEVHKELHDLSADIISRTAFGSSYEEGKRIFELQDQQIINTLQAMNSVQYPGFRFLPTKKNMMRWKLDREIRELVKNLIGKNNNTRKNSNNLLNLLISASQNTNGEDLQFDAEEVINECKSFYFAGKETTANLLTWAILLLALHQEWQAKAREEIIRVCKANEPVNAENLNDLEIVNMILYETLRLYPPVPLLTRQTSKNIKLGRLNVPAQTQFNLPMIDVHHNVEIWGEDANEFNPLRFSEPGKPLGAFFPFSLGPRNCVGQNLAMVESKIVLAMIIQHFSFVVSPLYAHAPTMLLTLQPQFGAQVLFRRRT
ncbi:oxygenase [Lithospermum erythrorhizon]|uniref:Oxygenase n=1 Tax=Lithospermum erythrorhizon TaxID=34254 RepID=A0AAV3R3G9_LITER